MDQTERRSAIRAELERRAKARETIKYGDIARIVGMIPNGLVPDLDAIKAQEANHLRPDLGCLVVNARTGFPGNVGSGEAERSAALKLREAVFKAWAGRS